MSVSPPTLAKTAGGAFEQLLDVEKLANAQRINLLRLFGAIAFLALECLPGPLIGQRADGGTLVLMAAYGVIALALLPLARRFEKAARLSRLAIPFMDMPVVYFIQHLNLLHATAPRAVGNFTLAIFISYILLAGLSLERWQITLAAVTAMTLQLAIHWQAGEPTYGMIGGALLLAGVTTLCAFARRRQTDMVWALCEEQLRRERLGRYFSPWWQSRLKRPARACPVPSFAK